MQRLVDAAWRLIFRLAFGPRRTLLRWSGIGRGGVVVAIRSDDAVLVVRHSYRRRLDFPGGGIDRGETPEACAHRELREEIGVDVPPGALRSLGVVRRDFGGSNARNHLFEWRVERLPDVRVDNRELIWAGALRVGAASRADLDLPVRWYLRRHAADLPCARDDGARCRGADGPARSA